MQTHRTLFGSALLVCGFSLAAAEQQAVVVPNNLFTAAGFVVKYAITPEKSAMLRSLPPDKLVKRTKDGKLYYVYADATRCNCDYVGTPQAYAAYQNGGNDPSYGGSDQPSIAIQAIDSDIGAPYISADIVPGIDSILDQSFFPIFGPPPTAGTLSLNGK